MMEQKREQSMGMREGRPNGQRLEDMQEFLEVFPEAAKDPRLIPQEVWEEALQGRSLVGAYARYVNSRSRREMEELRRRHLAQQQNQENAARSTGSMRAVEQGLGDMDAFLRGFQE